MLIRSLVLLSVGVSAGAVGGYIFGTMRANRVYLETLDEAVDEEIKKYTAYLDHLYEDKKPEVVDSPTNSEKVDIVVTDSDGTIIFEEDSSPRLPFRVLPITPYDTLYEGIGDDPEDVVTTTVNTNSAYTSTITYPSLGVEEWVYPIGVHQYEDLDEGFVKVEWEWNTQEIYDEVGEFVPNPHEYLGSFEKYFTNDSGEIYLRNKFLEIDYRIVRVVP